MASRLNNKIPPTQSSLILRPAKVLLAVPYTAPTVMKRPREEEDVEEAKAACIQPSSSSPLPVTTQAETAEKESTKGEIAEPPTAADFAVDTSTAVVAEVAATDEAAA